MEYLLITIPVAYWFLNKIRGGGYPKIPKGKWMATAATGLIIGGITTNPILGLAAAVAYFVGEIFSWGQWISAAPHFFNKSWQSTYNTMLSPKKDGRDSGIHFLVSLVVKEFDNFTNYCIGCLFLRGIWWFAPIYAVLVVLGNLQIEYAVIATVASGIMMPISYYMAPKLTKGNWWSLGENIYGGFHGAILALALSTII